MLKSITRSNASLERAARWVHARVTGRIRFDPTFRIGKLIRGRNAQLVQIGSNDGKVGDPLYPLLAKNPGWKCLFVEPVPEVFTRLLSNHGGREGFKFENAAINDGQPQAFYFIDRQSAELEGLNGDYLCQVGSFNRKHVLRHAGQGREHLVREVEVQGMTVEHLLSKHAIERIDVLHIDAEGFDWKILSQLDLARWQPRVILFEHIHLPAPERAEALSTLSSAYAIADMGADYLCELRQ
jgi:FkbM family methyltransferase